MNNLINIFYDLPLWLQIYYQIEQNIIIRGLVRKISKGLNIHLLLIKEDLDYLYTQERITWYHINKNYELIADDSDEGINLYNYYYDIFESTQLFLTNLQYKL